MQQFALDWGPPRRQYTVSELTAEIADTLAGGFPDVWVAGEISGVRIPGSGHLYFTLKDAGAQLQAVIYRSAARYLRFKPQEGMAVLARGRLDVYPQKGQYQLIVETLEPQGHGALQLAFEQLKRKLAEEGLFDAARKRKLPRLPRRIGVVTSPTGAVIHDIVRVLSRRFPGIHVRLYPALVQGEGSVEEVCRGIEHFSRGGWADVVIVARGGGSLEDLWTFNEEAVARAIAACRAPVIAAIGHETDFTIADFVADLRAPTPSAAAELVICTRDELLEQVARAAARLEQGMRYRLAAARHTLEQQGFQRVVGVLQRNLGRRMQRCDELEYRMRDCAGRRLAGWRRRLDEREASLRRLDLRLRIAEARGRSERAYAALVHAAHWRLRSAQARLAPVEAQIRQLSPLAVLERGYAIVQDAGGQVVSDASRVRAGEEVAVRVARGVFAARVTKEFQPPMNADERR
jgi:exodeoxyribonuclease VII large subunit